VTDTEKDQLILKLVKQCSEQSHAIGYALGVLENISHPPYEKQLGSVCEMLAGLGVFQG